MLQTNRPATFYLNGYMVDPGAGRSFICAAVLHNTRCKTLHSGVLTIFFILFR